MAYIITAPRHRPLKRRTLSSACDTAAIKSYCFPKIIVTITSERAGKVVAYAHDYERFDTLDDLKRHRRRKAARC